MEPMKPRTIHYTELPPYKDGGPLSEEWDYYRREVERLLAEGHEGRWVFIKGQEILGIFDTREEAMAEMRKRYPFPRPAILVHQIRTREHLIGFLRGVEFPLTVFRMVNVPVVVSPVKERCSSALPDGSRLLCPRSLQ